MAKSLVSDQVQIRQMSHCDTKGSSCMCATSSCWIAFWFWSHLLLFPAHNSKTNVLDDLPHHSFAVLVDGAPRLS